MVINYAQGNTTIWDMDTNAVMNALGGFGIISGCSISKGTGDWDIDVTSGTVFITGTGEVSVGSGTVTITDSSGLSAGESRVTLITADTGGTLASVDGTAAANPDSPDIPTDEVLLGFVIVSEGDTTAADSDILDVPALLGDDSTRYESGGSHQLDLKELGGSSQIEELTPSGGGDAEFSTDFSLFRGHIFHLHNVIPSTDGDVPFVRTSTDGGTSFDSGTNDYTWSLSVVTQSGSAADLGDAGDTKIDITNGAGVGSAAGEPGLSGTINIYGTGTAKETLVSFRTSFVNVANEHHAVHGGGRRVAQEDVDAVQITFPNGIASGAIQHLGVF